MDFVVGVGGGKLTDLVGYCANLARIDFGVIPTLASNCAPWT
ncbi:iron-containing alcohol dehydrogenase, partial [Enterococcus faecium]